MSKHAACVGHYHYPLSICEIGALWVFRTSYDILYGTLGYLDRSTQWLSHRSQNSQLASIIGGLTEHGARQHVISTPRRMEHANDSIEALQSKEGDAVHDTSVDGGKITGLQCAFLLITLTSASFLVLIDASIISPVCVKQIS